MASIREAYVRDLAEIVRLHRQAGAFQALIDPRVPPDRREPQRVVRAFRSMIGTPGFSLLVGEEDGAADLTGFALGTIVDNKPFAVSRFGYIACLSVDKELRRQDVGGALWLAMRDWLISNGLTAAQTDVSLRNSAARAFWRRMGFVEFLDGLWRDTELEVVGADSSACRIREGTASDVDSVLVLWKEMMDIHAAIDERLTVGPRWSDDVARSFAQWTGSRKDRLIVADSPEGVIGFAVGSVVETRLGWGPSRYGHVAHLCVRAERRRRGVGRQLFCWLRDWFRDRGLASIHLYASPFNATSQRFWRSLGFQDYAQRQWCNLV